jgi:uncharacterized protein YbaP (TraB family)
VTRGVFRIGLAAAFALLVVAPRARAQAASEAAASQRSAKHIFYRVTVATRAKRAKRAEGAKGTKAAKGTPGATVYLLGSVHLLPPDAGLLPPVVDSAFDGAKVVVFETSLDSLETRSKELLAKAQFTGDTTLQSSLSPAAVPKVESILKAYGTSFEQVAHYKAWFVSLVLQQAIAQAAHFRADYGVDSQINGRAKEANKPRFGLEAVDVQLGLFDRMSLAQQESELLATKSPADALKELQAMKTMWLAGDAAGLDSLTHAGETSASAAITGAVLTSRNQSWLPKIEQYIRGHDDALIVVGAAHLVGKDGLVAMLRAKGYQVDQL